MAICEHLPRLALRSAKFALLRSFTHSSNDHSLAHHIMLTGEPTAPPGFDPNRPTGNDAPSMASVVSYVARGEPRDVPAAVMLPHALVHRTGRVIPGQFAGRMDNRFDPWLLDVAPECAGGYGACPNCFHFENLQFRHAGPSEFAAAGLNLPPALSLPRLTSRELLLRAVDSLRRDLDRQASLASLDRFHGQAFSILTSPAIARAFDLNREDPRTLDRYGRHQFGRSCVLARRLVEAGVRLVQVNVGNNETWDTHQSAWPVLKDKLLPPLDQALSALLDDLEARGLMESTLIVMGGEFGRTPRISTLPGARLAGRDHWGAVQSLFFAGGGVRGGNIVGSSDKLGAHPKTHPHGPEDLAATMYAALGMNRELEYTDRFGRPFVACRGSVIDELF
jgi:hypothetical protein